jgi:hypothetical protein
MTITEKRIKDKDDLIKRLKEKEDEYAFLNTQVEARTLEMKLLKTLISQLKNNINKI